MNARRFAGLLLIALAGGCYPIDSSKELDYGKWSRTAAVTYKLRIENAAHSDKTPVMVQIDQHEPVLIKRWREAYLTRGSHVVRVSSPDPGATAPPVEQRFDLIAPMDLYVRDPALAEVRKDAPPIELRPDDCGHIFLNADGGGNWGESMIECTGLFGEATVQIDDYPPFRVSAIPTYVSMRSGRHHFVAILRATRNQPERRFSGTFNIPDVGTRIVVHDQICPKDTRPSGIYGPT